MGRNKAALRFGGRTLLALIRAAGLATGLPVRVIRRDLVPRCGPLGGVYTALATSRTEAVLFLSCDMPFVTSQYLMKLMQRLSPKRSAIFTRSKAPGFPFIIRSSALPAIEKQLTGKRYSLSSLAECLQSAWLRPTQAEALVSWNINTPDDLKKGRVLWRCRQRPNDP